MIQAVVTKEFDVVPEFLCDSCMKPITDIGMAMMVWFAKLDRSGQRSPLYICHKGKCDKKIRAIHTAEQDISGGWHELSYGFQLFLESARERQR